MSLTEHTAERPKHNQHLNQWTPERERVLKQLFGEGRMLREIADRLGHGITECAVGHRARRLGLKRPRVSREWTGERLATLQELYDASKGYEQIAAQLGTSRSAIIGKCHRLGWQRNPPREKDNGERELVKRLRAIKRERAHGGVGMIIMRKSERAKQKTPRVSEVICAPPLHLTILELTDRTCKWPFGDRAPYSFCGHETALGRSYCEGHVAASSQVVSPRYFDQLATKCLGRVSGLSRVMQAE